MSGIIRARAPLRLGLAGGGTDVSPFCDEYGGCVLNVTIDRYAFASAEPRDDGKVVFRASDLNVVDEVEASGELPLDTGLRLHRGVYNRMVRDYNGGQPLSLTMTTHVDSPMGSGLGSSSALVVAMVTLMGEIMRAPLGEYDIAHIALVVERRDLNLNGGRQDQYAAAFGGFNFIEFSAQDRVIVNPLRVREGVCSELEASLVLFFTGASRESAVIIDNQTAAVAAGGAPLEAMHQLKADAIAMKEALLFGRIGAMAELLEHSWTAKKLTSSAVSNPRINRIYEAAKGHGAIAGKVSGAGGGGFMMFLVDPVRRPELIEKLRMEEDGYPIICGFSYAGARTWRTL
ncbi:MAG: dehydrogenase [Caulobacteraceae bacterium]|nr:dehydrogenase [Caulobacteraceae bacterium]